MGRTSKPKIFALMIACAVPAFFAFSVGCAANVENTPVVDTTSTPTVDSSPAPTPVDDATANSRGESDINLDDAVYSVDSGSSRAVFQVDEVLSFRPTDRIIVELATEEGNEDAFSGAVRFDGGISVITLDVHQLMSSQSNRDRYLREVLFPEPEGRFVEFEIPSLAPAPDGFTRGEEVATSVEGNIKINGVSTPAQFEVTARHDGDSVFVLGETTFTWNDVGVEREEVLEARAVVNVGEEISAQILLKFLPEN